LRTCWYLNIESHFILALINEINMQPDKSGVMPLGIIEPCANAIAIMVLSHPQPLSYFQYSKTSGRANIGCPTVIGGTVPSIGQTITLPLCKSRIWCRSSGSPLSQTYPRFKCSPGIGGLAGWRGGFFVQSQSCMCGSPAP